MSGNLLMDITPDLVVEAESYEMDNEAAVPHVLR